VDEATLARMSPHIAALAEAEGLAAHAESVRLRGLSTAPPPSGVSVAP
jgi:histidinol dehydrogenase